MDNVHHRPVTRLLEVDAMSVDPLMLTPSEVRVSIRRPFDHGIHGSNDGVERNETFESPPRSPMEAYANAGYFDLPLQSGHRISASLAPMRRPSDGSNRIDASDQDEGSINSIAELDGNQGGQKSSFQRALQGLGFRRIISRRKSDPIALTGGPVRPDYISPRPHKLGLDLTLPSDHLATMTSENCGVSCEPPPAEYDDPKTPQNATLKRPKLTLIIPTSSEDQGEIPLIAHYPQRSPQSPMTETRDGVEAKTASSDPPGLSTLPMSPAREKIMAKVLYDFEGEDDEELMIEEDETIQIIRRASKGEAEKSTSDGQN